MLCALVFSLALATGSRASLLVGPHPTARATVDVPGLWLNESTVDVYYPSDVPAAAAGTQRFVAFAHKQEHDELQACVAELQVARAEALAHRNATVRERERDRIFAQGYRSRRRAQ